MPRNPNLVPTVVVDVNGRTTVVHKLKKLFSSSAPKRSGDKIPVPSIPGERAWKSTIVNTLIKTVPRAAGLTDKAAIKKLEKNLFMDFSEPSLRFFCEVMTREDGVPTGVADQLAKCKFPDDSSAQLVAERLVKKIRLNIMFCDLLETDDFNEVDMLVNGVRGQEPFADVDLRYLDERSIEQAVAVVKATRRLKDDYPVSMEDDVNHPVSERNYWGSNKSLILTDSLFEMVMSRPEDMERIVDIVVENQTTNPETINGIMMGISAPLAEGAL